MQVRRAVYIAYVDENSKHRGCGGQGVPGRMARARQKELFPDFRAMNWGFIGAIVVSASIVTALLVSMAWWMFGL